MPGTSRHCLGQGFWQSMKIAPRRNILFQKSQITLKSRVFMLGLGSTQQHYTLAQLKGDFAAFADTQSVANSLR